MQRLIEKYLKGDKVIWTIIAFIILIIVMAYSSSSNLAFRISGVAPYVIKHTLIIIIGIVLIIYLQFFPIVFFLDYL